MNGPGGFDRGNPFETPGARELRQRFGIRPLDETHISQDRVVHGNREDAIDANAAAEERAGRNPCQRIERPDGK